MSQEERRAAVRRMGAARRSAWVRMLATGLAATVAASGLAATSAEASTTIFACYSNTTDALQYLKPPATTCPTGTTLLSWSQTGPQGPQGAKGFNWRGAWNSTTAYAVGDVVGYSGASWIAKVANTGSTPAISNTNWFTVAARGAVGAPGAQGAQGAVGAQGSQGMAGSHGTAGSQGAQGKAGAQGTVGAQGVPGPQGPAGAVAGYYNYNESARPIGYEYSDVVATLTPASTGDYVINGFATAGFSSGHTVSCWIDTVNSDGNLFSSTPRARNGEVGSGQATLPMTGEVLVDPGSTIQEVCRYSGSGHGNNLNGYVSQTAITATRLSTKSSEEITEKRPQQKFTLPRIRKR